MKPAIIILRGIPGSGKTTWRKKNFPDALVCSADDYFYDPSGKYNFDPTRLREAHNECFKKYHRAIMAAVTGDPVYHEFKTVIVDNTNLKQWEIAPYYRLAEAFDFRVSITQFICSPIKAAARCVHGVPHEKIHKMHLGMDPLPDWWNVSYVEG